MECEQINTIRFSRDIEYLQSRTMERSDFLDSKEWDFICSKPDLLAIESDGFYEYDTELDEEDIREYIKDCYNPEQNTYPVSILDTIVIKRLVSYKEYNDVSKEDLVDYSVKKENVNHIWNILNEEEVEQTYDNMGFIFLCSLDFPPDSDDIDNEIKRLIKKKINQ